MKGWQIAQAKWWKKLEVDGNLDNVTFEVVVSAMAGWFSDAGGALSRVWRKSLRRRRTWPSVGIAVDKIFPLQQSYSTFETCKII